MFVMHERKDVKSWERGKELLLLLLASHEVGLLPLQRRQKPNRKRTQCPRRLRAPLLACSLPIKTAKSQLLRVSSKDSKTQMQAAIDEAIKGQVANGATRSGVPNHALWVNSTHFLLLHSAEHKEGIS